MTGLGPPPTSRAVKNFAGYWFFGLIALGVCASCSPSADYALVGSAYVPAAHGDITLEKIDKGQRLINITMDHLPPPEEVGAGLTAYVVWFAAVGELPTAQGTLDYDAKARVGRTAIATSMSELDVQITAERSESPMQPSDLVVASQKIREN